jgi:hypothetical protein
VFSAALPFVRQIKGAAKLRHKSRQIRETIRQAAVATEVQTERGGLAPFSHAISSSSFAFFFIKTGVSYTFRAQTGSFNAIEHLPAL